MFVLNWSSRNREGAEPEYRPFTCGVGTRNCPLASFTFNRARAIGLIEGSSANALCSVCAERSAQDITLENGSLDARCLEERIIGVESFIPEVFVSDSVKVVCTALGE